MKGGGEGELFRQRAQPMQMPKVGMCHQIHRAGASGTAWALRGMTLLDIDSGLPGTTEMSYFVPWLVLNL